MSRPRVGASQAPAAGDPSPRNLRVIPGIDRDLIRDSRDARRGESRGRAVVPPFAPTAGEPPPLSSWGWIGLEVVADLAAWGIVFLLVTTAGAGVLTGQPIALELLIIFGLFALVGLVIRFLFLSVRRRRAFPVRGSRGNVPPPGQNV